jgi:hypothetical protein
MSKQDVLAVLETDMNDPGSLKSGEYLESHILLHAKQFLRTDRLGLIDALSEWISLKSEPRTMLAIRAAQELDLKEMRQIIESLRKEVAVGRVFPRFYLRDIDDVLSSLS